MGDYYIMTAGYDIYLMAGQSNMCGRGTAVDILQDFNDPRVFQFGGSINSATRYRTIFLGNDPAHNEEYANSGKVSPIFHFAKSVALQTPSDRRILLVPVAHGGTTLMNNGPWASGNPGRPLYENAIAQANAAIAAARQEYPESYFKGIVWLQGEGDAVNHTQAGYSAALDAAMLGYRSRIEGAQNAAVIILQMVPDYVVKTNGNINRAHEDTPRRLDYSAFAYGQGGAAFQNGDDLHYNAAGSRLLGKAAAIALRSALKNHPSFPLVSPAYAPIIKSVSGSTIIITFDAPLCQFDSFKVEYKAEGESAWTTAPAPLSTALGTRVRTISGLNLGVTYEIRVSTIAKNSLVSAPSPSTFISLNNAVPSKVLNLRTLNTSNSSVLLAWDLPAQGGASIDYKIEYKFSSEADWIVYSDGVSTALQCEIEGLLQETSYDFRVSGYNTIGFGEASDVLSVSTSEVPRATAENGAIAHWLFGLDNPNFSDLVNASVLIKNGEEPLLANSSMTIRGKGAGLLSAFDETPNMTFCVIAKRENISAILGGNLKSGGGGGFSPFLSARATSPAISANERGGFGGIAIDSSLDGLGQFVFIAVSINSTGNRVLFVGKPTTSAVNTGTATRSISNPVRKISVGDVHYNATTFAGNPTICEVILFDSAKSQSELNDIYLRSKARMVARGIFIY
jgi:hypothetical protein